MASDSPVGHPSEWPVVQLGDITLKIGSGSTPRGGEENYLSQRSKFALVRSQNVFDRHFDTSGLAFISDEQAASMKGVVLQPRDLLLNITGDGITFSRCCVIPSEILPACVNQHVAIIRVKQDVADPGYILSYLTHPATKTYIESFNAGGSRRAITKGHIESFRIALPSVGEQRAIAHILDTLDDRIELNRRMNETLEGMARALFKSWFVDFDPVRAKAEGRQHGLPRLLGDLFPSSFQSSGLGPIPLGWETKLLSELCTLGRGASPRPINDFMNGEVPWVKIADATAANGPFLFETREKLKKAGVDKSVKVMPGDLILSNSATCGMPIFVELHGCIHDGWLYFKNLRLISKIYLYQVLMQLAQHLVHIADGSVQKNLNTNLVGQQTVLVPPKHLLEAFERQASALFMRMRQNGLASRTLRDLRDALLPRLLSGELTIPNVERIVGGQV